MFFRVRTLKLNITEYQWLAFFIILFKLKQQKFNYHNHLPPIKTATFQLRNCIQRASVKRRNLISKKLGVSLCSVF